jgi:hypothetical protein
LAEAAITLDAEAEPIVSANDDIHMIPGCALRQVPSSPSDADKLVLQAPALTGVKSQDLTHFHFWLIASWALGG